MPERSERNDRLDRLDRIESAVLKTSSDVASLTADLRQVVKTQSSQSSLITDLQQEDRNRRNTPWPTLISLALLLVVVGGLALQPVRHNLSWLAEEFEEHRDRDGHPAVLERVASIQRDSDRIEREAEKLEDAVIADRVTAARWEGEVRSKIDSLSMLVQMASKDNEQLDEILQREMGLLDAQTKMDAQWMRSQIESLSSEVTKSVSNRAEMTAWIEAIRERIKEKHQ